MILFIYYDIFSIPNNRVALANDKRSFQGTFLSFLRWIDSILAYIIVFLPHLPLPLPLVILFLIYSHLTLDATEIKPDHSPVCVNYFLHHLIFNIYPLLIFLY